MVPRYDQKVKNVHECYCRERRMVAGSKGSAGAHGIKKNHLRILVIFETHIGIQMGIAMCKCDARMVAHGKYVCFIFLSFLFLFHGFYVSFFAVRCFSLLSMLFLCFCFTCPALASRHFLLLALASLCFPQLSLPQ